MKSRLRYIFRIILLVGLFFPMTVQAQMPGDSIPAGQDTTFIPADTIMAPIDTITVPADSLIQNKDTTNLPTDSLDLSKSSGDTTQIAEDTIRQKEPQTVAPKPADTVNVSWGGVSLMVDYLKFGSYILGNNEKYEGSLAITFFEDFMIVAEGGYGLLVPERAIKNGSYRSEGIYGRIGINFILINSPSNKIYLGFRYAQSRFEDQGSLVLESSVWPSYQRDFTRKNLTADWAELVFGTEGALKYGFYMGWTLRFRFLNNYDKFDLFPIDRIPGYGMTTSKMVPALNLYLKYHLDF